MSFRAIDSNTKWMKVIENPITDHLPVACKKYVISFTGKLTTCKELVPKEQEPIALVIGAFAHGSVSSDYTEGDFSNSITIVGCTGM